MSNTQFAFLAKENVPSKEQWQSAIDELKFSINLQIDPELVPFEDEGFSPCIWGDNEHDVGFEIYYDPSADIHGDDADLTKIIGDNDYSISMCWDGSMKDCAAVMIASCALATAFGAVISYQGQAPEALDKLISDTKEIIVDAIEED